MRSSGERTTDLCLKLVKAEVSPENVIVTPTFDSFNECFDYCLRYCMNISTSYVAMIDADVLIRPGVLRQGEKLFNNLSNEFGFINSFTYDKFHVGRKPGGIHLYRTQVLHKIFHLLPLLKEMPRPETSAKELACRHLGVRQYIWWRVTSVHDFLQFRMDLIRKVSFRLKKNSELMVRYSRLFKVLGFMSSDYQLAFDVIIAMKGRVVNPNEVSSKNGVKFELFSYNEKKPLNSSAISLAYRTEIPFLFWGWVFFAIKRIKLFEKGFHLVE